MRDQGRLVEWFDEKGYGFIQPNDDSKDRVFLHIKDFAPARSSSYFRLCVGIQRACGCARALSCTASQLFKSITNPKEPYPKSLTEKTEQGQRWSPMQIASVAYIVFLALLVLLGRLSGLVLLLISVMNAASYWF